MVAASALIIALRPSFPLVLAALVLQAITGGFLGLAVAAISLGLVGHAALGKRLGRNQRFASTGGVIAAGLMGVIGYILSFRAIFFAAAALVLPLLAALGRIQLSGTYGGVSGAPGYQELSAKARRWSLWKNGNLLTFAGCECLFQLGNASMLPLAGEALVFSKEAFSSLIVSALIIVPQLIVALMASQSRPLWSTTPASRFARQRAMSVWPCLSRSGSSTIRLPSFLTQAMSGLLVAQPTCMPSAAIMTRAKLWRRRLFMSCRYARWWLSPPTLDFRKCYPSAAAFTSLGNEFSAVNCGTRRSRRQIAFRWRYRTSSAAQWF